MQENSIPVGLLRILRSNWFSIEESIEYALQGKRENIIVRRTNVCYNSFIGKPESKRRLTLLFDGGATLQTKERGDANVCYISWLDSGWNIHCRPCESVVSDFQGKEIAATTGNSDGWPFSEGLGYSLSRVGRISGFPFACLYYSTSTWGVQEKFSPLCNPFPKTCNRFPKPCSSP